MSHAWPPAQPPLPLGEHEAHVWLASLDLSPPAMTLMQHLLSDEEHRKAARFRFERDRLRWSAAHAFMRHVLGSYLNRPPRDLEFAIAPHGKPSIVCHPGMPDLRFNMAHSHDHAVLALTLGCEVGVDLEWITPLDDADRIAASFFSPYEQAILQNVPAIEKLGAFYRCWSRKEAVLKAFGAGLTVSLDSFDVTLAPGDPPQVLALREEMISTGPWSLIDLQPLDGFAGALACVEPMAHISFRQWTLPHT
jgi:4'-phosphopantetheinyl transferase